MTLRQLSGEPLFHFFVLGAGLFMLFGWFDRDAMQAPGDVVIDRPRVDGLAAQFELVWRRPPTPEELRGLVDEWIREEILYREGVALGLDANDPVVRRRIAEKMAFIADGIAPSEPTDAELAEWLAANANRYRIEPTYSLQQVFFDPVRHGDDLQQQLEALVQSPPTLSTLPEGDATLLPSKLTSARSSEVARTFGSDFAGTLAALPVGEWRGPVASAYGLHLVRIDEMTPGRDGTLEEVRAAVERDWSAAQSARMSEAFYEAVRDRYAVRIEADIENADDPARSASSSAR